MAEKHAENLFLQEKPTLALLAIWSFERTYASVITKEINSTFAHTTKILSKMEDCGLVQFKMDGRVKYVELTDRGMDVVNALKNLILKLENETEENSPANNISSTFQNSESQSSEESESQKVQSINSKVVNLRLKIENIYEELSNNNEDSDAIARKLGPFKRDIKKLEDQIESSQNPVDDIAIITLNDTRQRLDNIINQGQ
ncbi:transcriptional regulator, MarR family [Methanohalobium evestigatum Z-7303]|uniref:Transcriptional regulator, MarR family n=1 Tax=Methanohalobium evestigatum (strain ATCC BAA-1072 / DSM 3721 / NBRC 107634 / OCM 161 / Z-7303) TaxID=644295 RepID=D7EAU4_METEZ|nr:MarR family transcriptional regulator [Methanohalobium evestigatum]ADI74461.1 transcriptional regulator, MarR family [Methanohalobium evestigatum Z-7303]